MKGLTIKLDDGAALLAELQDDGAEELELGAVIALPGMMKPSGRPAVALHLRGPMGSHHFALTSLDLFASANRALTSRFGDPAARVEPGSSLLVGEAVEARAPFTLGLDLDGAKLRGVFIRPAKVGDLVLGFAPEDMRRGDIAIMDDAGKNWSVHR
jgi:hypothetical protein